MVFVVVVKEQEDVASAHPGLIAEDFVNQGVWNFCKDYYLLAFRIVSLVLSSLAEDVDN